MNQTNWKGKRKKTCDLAIKQWKPDLIIICFLINFFLKELLHSHVIKPWETKDTCSSSLLSYKSTKANSGKLVIRSVCSIQAKLCIILRCKHQGQGPEFDTKYCITFWMILELLFHLRKNLLLSSCDVSIKVKDQGLTWNTVSHFEWF